MGCLKEIQKHQTQENLEQMTEQVLVPVLEDFSELKQKQKKQMYSKGGL